MTQPSTRNPGHSGLRLATAVLAGALVAIAFYAADRSRAAILSPPFDPVAVIASARIEYFWRMQLSVFAGSLAAAVVYTAAAGREQRVLRLLVSALPWIALAASAAMVVYA
jgi:hypothetical protein